MEPSAPFGLLLLLLGAALGLRDQTYFLLGGCLVLRPAAVPERITTVWWRRDEALVAWWVEGDERPGFHGALSGRAALDTRTGTLEVCGAGEADGGDFSVEVNMQPLGGGWRALGLGEVPRPVVSWRGCRCPAVACTLSCEGDARRAEPVRYSWRRGLGGAWVEGGPELSVGPDAAAAAESFACSMENAVSRRESDAHAGPLAPDDRSALWLQVCGAVGRTAAFLLLSAAGLHLMCTNRRGAAAGDQAAA